MKKFHRELPDEVIDLLSISNGWLIGNSIKNLINKEKPLDYDIIVPKNNYRTTFRFLRIYNPTFNNHGGIKADIKGINVDVWIDTLEEHLLNVGTNFTYAYHFNKNLLIKKEE